MYACNNFRKSEQIFIKYNIGSFYKKIVEKFQFWLKVDNNNRHCVFSKKDVITTEMYGYRDHILSREL
jgi:hypothetical protein